MLTRGKSFRMPLPAFIALVASFAVALVAGSPASGSSTTAAPAAPAASAALTPPVATGFQPLTPGRIADTRPGSPVGQGATLKVLVRGQKGVPASGVGSVALNITAVKPAKGGFVTVFPTGTARPTTSTLNFVTGQTVANSLVTGLGADGTISIYNAVGATDILVDVTGWFPTGSGVTAITPKRFLDTRSGAALTAGGTRTITVAGGSTGIPADAVAVTATVTATRGTASSFLTVYPAGKPRPATSSVNFTPNRTVPNSLFATVGTGGQIVVHNYSGSVHVLVDVTGYLSPTSGYIALPTPQRVGDTRSGSYYVGNGYGNTGLVGSAGAAFNVAIPRQGTTPVMPFGTGAAVVNVTATRAFASGYATAWPYGAAQPPTSTLNISAGGTVANGAILGANEGFIDVAMNSGNGAYIILDVTGYFPADGVGLVNASVNYRNNSIGAERIGIFWCELSGQPLNRASIINTLNTVVRPYYAWVSRDRYDVTFYDSGASRVYTSAQPQGVCLDETKAGAVTSARAFNGVIGILGWERNAAPNWSMGFAGPGSPMVTAYFPGNSRAGEISANSVFNFGTSGPAVAVAAHELGHMLDFPHSFTPDSSSEYTNLMDIMSRSPESVTGAGLGRTKIIAPLAVDRLRAGWIDPAQVRIHPGGTVTYTVNPVTGTGVQLVAIRSGIPGKFTTVEVRRKAGSYDLYLDKAGVEVNKVQDYFLASDPIGNRWHHGLSSRVSPAVGTAGQLTHVLGAGQSLTLGTVTVAAGTPDASGNYPVTISGGATWNFPTLIAGQADGTPRPTDADHGRSRVVGPPAPTFFGAR